MEKEGVTARQISRCTVVLSSCIWWKRVGVWRIERYWRNIKCRELILY